MLYSEKVKSQELLLIERDKEAKKNQEEHENDLQKLAKSQSDLEDTKEKLKDAMEKLRQQENSLINNENGEWGSSSKNREKPLFLILLDFINYIFSFD